MHPFPGKGYVFIWVEDSRHGQQITNKQFKTWRRRRRDDKTHFYIGHHSNNKWGRREKIDNKKENLESWISEKGTNNKCKKSKIIFIYLTSMNIAFRNIFFIPFDKLGHELNHSAFVYDWFVCLFGGITPHSRIVRSYGDGTISTECS